MSTEKKNRFIRWPLIINICLFIVTVIVVVFFVTAWKGGCERRFKGNLFDEKVLNKYEISWLKKPQNAANESQRSDLLGYNYDCSLNSVEECLSYAEEVFTNFKNGNYVLGYCARTISDKWQTSYYEVALSDNLEDYCGSADLAADGFASYQFFYSTTPISEMGETFYGGKYMGHLYLSLGFSKVRDADSYWLTVSLHVKKEKNSNILCVY